MNDINASDVGVKQAVDAAQQWALDQGDSFTISQAQDLVSRLAPYLRQERAAGRCTRKKDFSFDDMDRH